jgi:hypothetical protein
MRQRGKKKGVGVMKRTTEARKEATSIHTMKCSYCGALIRTGERCVSSWHTMAYVPKEQGGGVRKVLIAYHPECFRKAVEE